MKMIKVILIFLAIAYSQLSLSLELVLSSRLSIDFGSPDKIINAHTAVISYHKSGLTLSQEPLDPKTMYNGSPDLTGHLECFIFTLFDEGCERELPKKLKEFSALQAKDLGFHLPENKKEKFTIGNTKVFLFHNADRQEGYSFIFDRSTIYRFDGLNISHEKFSNILHSIKQK